MDGGRNFVAPGTIPATNLKALKKVVDARIQVDGQKCCDNLFLYYQKFGYRGLCKMGSGLTAKYFDDEFGGFSIFGITTDPSEIWARRNITDSLVEGVQGALTALPILGDGKSREIVDQCLKSFSNVVFWVIEWRKYVENNKTAKAA